MKLSTQTLNVLKNFSAINVNLFIGAGDTISTISPTRNIMARSKLPDSFPQEFAIYDLNNFIATVGLFADGEIDFAKEHAIISNADSNINYYFAAPSIVEPAPNKELVMDDELFEFKMTPEDVTAIGKVASVLNAPQLSITSAKGKVKMVLNDRKTSTSNSYSKTLAGTPKKDFDVVISVENFKLMPGNYVVSVGQKKGKGVITFKNQDIDLTYWLTVETDSTI
jgi:hypothetical protein